ncbi:class I SAM-dependent methyltransferase [Streptomyces sp. NPDC059582]|uniref:class I SAM-dependent methyltransferase n=1 Tax=Streptomyces sp. NPDC059582 TaxID=3346875 RepID=UPI00368EC007
MTPEALLHWEAHFAAGSGFRRPDAREIGLLARAVPPGPDARALDVGCGLGGYAAALAGLGFRTLAVDATDSAVAATRDRYEGLEPLLEARRLDFEDAAEVAARLPPRSFDLVTTRLVLPFLADRRGAVERVRGLLSPGGTWVVTTPLTDRLPEERRRIGLTPADVGALVDGWQRGHWYDLQPGDLRCFVLRG